MWRALPRKSWYTESRVWNTKCLKLLRKHVPLSSQKVSSDLVAWNLIVLYHIMYSRHKHDINTLGKYILNHIQNQNYNTSAARYHIALYREHRAQMYKYICWVTRGKSAVYKNEKDGYWGSLVWIEWSPKMRWTSFEFDLIVKGQPNTM
jgi:hypothetical protein